MQTEMAGMQAEMDGMKPVTDAYKFPIKHATYGKITQLGFALMLSSGQNLIEEVTRCVNHSQIHIAAVVGCIGTVTGATVRLRTPDGLDHPDNPIKQLTSRQQFMSMEGTVCKTGEFHLVASFRAVGDEGGEIVGGRITRDMKIFTSAKVSLSEYVPPATRNEGEENLIAELLRDAGRINRGEIDSESLLNEYISAMQSGSSSTQSTSVHL